MLRRIIGAATLNISVYEEVEADRSATVQALGVVILVSLVIGIKFLILGDFANLFQVVGLAIVTWGLLALITYVVGTTLFRTAETEADWGQLLRTLGFAQSPRILFLFAPVAGAIGLTIALAAWFWWLVASVIAVRQALDYRSTLRAVGVTFIGFLPQIFLIFFILRQGQGT